MPFSGAPVLTLGEPILAPLVCGEVPTKVREYWGYAPGWQSAPANPAHYRFIPAADNRLHHTIFPYPHQPSVGKRFYRERLDSYTAFARANAFPDLALHLPM